MRLPWPGIAAAIGGGVLAAVGQGLQASPSWLGGLGLGLVLVGGATAAIALVSLVFAAANQRSFEWFLAWRYLRRTERAWVTLVVGIALILAAGAIWWVAHALTPAPVGGIVIEAPRSVWVLKGVALGVAILGWLVALFGGLLQSFSVFTSISIFGVHLGTAALVVVLSVMGGFEQDLRQKILGTRAHVVVTKKHGVFREQRWAMGRLEQVPGVRAISPYLEAEVMMTSQSNLSGVLLRGIDVARADHVTDLRRYIASESGAGRLEYLDHPERLARIPSATYDHAPEQDEGPERIEGAGEAKGQHGDRAPPSSDEDAQEDTAREHAARGEQAQKPPAQGDDAPIPRRPVYPGVIVGAELARNLRLYVGDDVNLVSPLGGMSPAGPIPKARAFRVAAIFYSGMWEFDTKYAYITRPEAERFLDMQGEVSGLEIRVNDVDAAGAVAARVAQRLGPAYEVRDWREINRSLFSALKMEKVVMFIVLTFIVLVACFSIVTNLIMMVLEKGREIAALKALGTTSTAVLRVFVYAGLYIGVIGMLMGLLEGISICLYLARIGLPLDPEVYYIARLPVKMSSSDITIVALAAVTMSFLATVYPALRAAQLNPVDGLRRVE